MPYELGRAKARNITSLQTAGWFQGGQSVKTCGDYVQLAVMAKNEPELASWLQTVAGSVPHQVPVSIDCRIHNTIALK